MKHSRKKSVRRFYAGGVPTTARNPYEQPMYPFQSEPVPVASEGATTNNTITVNGQDVSQQDADTFDNGAGPEEVIPMRRGGQVKSKKSKPRSRGDGIAKRGKTRGRFV